MGSENAHEYTIERYHTKMAMNFSNHMIRVTGDETWVSFVNVETKEQSKQWMHIHSLTQAEKV
jgi:hypothetical protein